MTAARFRLFVKELTPPVLWGALKRAKDVARAPRRAEPVVPPPSEAFEPPEWEYAPEGWARPTKGWDVDAVVAAYRKKWPSYVEALREPRPLGVYHEVVAGETVAAHDREAHNMLVSYAYVLVLAAHGRERLSILDWGGGLGHYLALGLAVLPGIELDYHCRELPKVAAAGREVFPEASFHSDDSCLEREYDLVLASSSLQYAEEWRALLRGLARATAGYLYVTRVPVALRAPSFVVLQRAHRYGYDTEYLGWVLNRDELLREAGAASVQLVREFLLFGEIDAEEAPERPVEHRGFLFRPSAPR
jgi:putative methyltransferase (TIGR04325 family)